MVIKELRIEIKFNKFVNNLKIKSIRGFKKSILNIVELLAIEKILK